MTDFFICPIKFGQCTDKNSETNISIAIFLAGVIMYQKRQISLPVGYKTRRLGIIVTSFRDLNCEKHVSLTLSYFLINSALLYHFLANLLGKNQKMSEKSVFCKASGPEMTSQSFPVSWFCTPPEVKFDAFDTLKHRQRKTLSKYLFLLFLSVHCGNFIEQIKKICHIHFKLF